MSVSAECAGFDIETNILEPSIEAPVRRDAVARSTAVEFLGKLLNSV